MKRKKVTLIFAVLSLTIALVMANMYRVGFFEPSYVPPRHIGELRALTRKLEKITKMMSDVKESILSQLDAFSTQRKGNRHSWGHWRNAIL